VIAFVISLSSLAFAADARRAGLVPQRTKIEAWRWQEVSARATSPDSPTPAAPGGSAGSARENQHDNAFCALNQIAVKINAGPWGDTKSTV